MARPDRQFVKSALVKMSRYSGLNAIVRRSRRQSVLVLCYHGVVSESRPAVEFPYSNTVSRKEFTYQLSVLRHFFQPISASDWIKALDGRGRLPDRPVLVTFDDGYLNNLTNAAPILERYGVPALISVCAGYVGTDQLLWTHELQSRILRWPLPMLPMPGGEIDRLLSDDLKKRRAVADYVRTSCKQLADSERRAYLDRLRHVSAEHQHDDEELTAFLSWDDVRALRRRGFEIGSHTLDHPILTRLAPEAMSYQLAESRAVIEREIGAQCSSVAYPNGGPSDFSSEVVTRASAAGYRLGFTLAGRFSCGDDPLAISRITVPGHSAAGVFHAKISGIYNLWPRSTMRRSSRSVRCGQPS